MAKSDPSGIYRPEAFNVSGNLVDVSAYIARELERIAAAFEFALARQVEFRNVAPDKPRNGFLYGADGVNWNPGSGQGVYAYYNGAWHFLG